MHRSPALENEELMALYRAEEDSFFEKDEDCISEENELESECDEEARGGRGPRSSLSLEIHGLQREEQVYFSNQEYYRRLEELKSNHLRNMADLERMYISQGKDGRGGDDDRGLRGWTSKEEKQPFSHFDRKCSDSLFGSGPTRKLQRINSQEELDFHDTSSGSDQSEPCVEELSWTFSQDQTFERDILFSPEQLMAKRNFRFQSKPKPQGRASHQTGARVQSNSKVTVPRPFQMMLREEERKRHRVRTRSEVELENTLLRRELEELRECQKKFRASPAPAHIHLPLYEIISRRPRGRNGGDHFRERSHEVSLKPFPFLERERRKREAKIAAELGKFAQREERQAFKARALPSSVYGNRHGANTRSPSLQHQLQTVFIMEREATEGQSDQSCDLELDVQQSDSSTDFSRPQRPSSSKSVKKQIEVSIEMVKERK
ncbi:protein FAM161A [Kryptolebias marmoratus]|uniref:Protein FAM161A n=1 Tax=Kryptolebias marmoratus TaxID=37003 RepID=A0A3Q3AXC5_KRYMA|nr:protein FAM161A [Kryptolebias marmoratus]